VIELGI